MLVLGVSEAKVPSVMRKEQYTIVGVGTTVCLSWLARKLYCVVIEYPLQEVLAGHGGMCIAIPVLGG